MCVSLAAYKARQLRYVTELFRCSLQILSTIGDMYIMLFFRYISFCIAGLSNFVVCYLGYMLFVCKTFFDILIIITLIYATL